MPDSLVASRPKEEEKNVGIQQEIKSTKMQMKTGSNGRYFSTRNQPNSAEVVKSSSSLLLVQSEAQKSEGLVIDFKLKIPQSYKMRQLL